MIDIVYYLCLNYRAACRQSAWFRLKTESRGRTACPVLSQAEYLPTTVFKDTFTVQFMRMSSSEQMSELMVVDFFFSTCQHCLPWSLPTSYTCAPLSHSKRSHLATSARISANKLCSWHCSAKVISSFVPFCTKKRWVVLIFLVLPKETKGINTENK